MLPVVDGQPIVDAEHPFPIMPRKARISKKAVLLAVARRSFCTPSISRWMRSAMSSTGRSMGCGCGSMPIGPKTVRQSCCRRSCLSTVALGWSAASASHRSDVRFGGGGLNRLAPRFPLPATIHDCKAAVAWVREHGPEYGGTFRDCDGETRRADTWRRCSRVQDRIDRCSRVSRTKRLSGARRCDPVRTDRLYRHF